MSDTPQTGGIRNPSDASAASRLGPEPRQEIEAVLSAFRQWLLDAEAWPGEVQLPDDQELIQNETDLHTLVGEWLGLKHELRREARDNQEARRRLDLAIEQFQQGVDSVRDSSRTMLEPLLRERDHLRDEANERLDAQTKSWLELILEIRDSIERSAVAARETFQHLGPRRWLLPRPLLSALSESSEFALWRIDAALESRDIRPISCQGQPVDPKRMIVVETIDHDRVPGGHVAEIVRSGFTWGNKIVRCAEVRAVKTTTQDQE